MNPSPSALPPDHDTRMERARLAIDGLSVGDAFGECFFRPELVKSVFEGRRVVPPPPWRTTDDTEMGLSVTETLEQCGGIHQDRLAQVFALRHAKEPRRGYGAMAHEILSAIHRGRPWRVVSPQVFGGQGSMGNGSAMRVAPVGAYFGDDLARAAAEARASAEITHPHPEGQAGAIAVAIAAAWAWRVGSGQEAASPGRFFEVTLDHTPEGETRRGIEKAREFPLHLSPVVAAQSLGSGRRVTSPDTVPFTIWCAARHLDDYTEALWTTVAGLGDRDTTCAIVGGIVALSAGRASLPADWLEAREPLRYPA